jgi:acetyl esterase/lipase
MPILNREKVRPDVLKMFDKLQKVQIKGLSKFLRENKDEKIDFLPLWEKVMKANEELFKGEVDKEEILKLLTMDEMLYLTRMLRYMFVFMSDHEQKQFPISDNVKIESVDAGGVPAEWQIVPDVAEDKVIFYLHGGGYIIGSINSYRLLTVAIGEETKMRIFSVDYRLAPENPFPASVEDSTTAYKWLLSTGIKPENIIIAGDSAGGNLSLVTLLKLKNEGVELPAGAVLISPIVDYTLSDESFFKKAETDLILADIGIFWWFSAYVADADGRNPLISPLFGDLKGLPPLLFQASTSEMLYSDSVRFIDKAKAAGVDATLQTWDDMSHAFQGFFLNALPEAREAITKIGEFIHKIIT